MYRIATWTLAGSGPGGQRSACSGPTTLACGEYPESLPCDKPTHQRPGANSVSVCGAWRGSSRAAREIPGGEPISTGLPKSGPPSAPQADAAAAEALEPLRPGGAPADTPCRAFYDATVYPPWHRAVEAAGVLPAPSVAERWSRQLPWRRPEAVAEAGASTPSALRGRGWRGPFARGQGVLQLQLASRMNAWHEHFIAVKNFAADAFRQAAAPLPQDWLFARP